MFALLDEGPDVPAYVRLEVLAHAVLDQGDACVALAEVDHDEALHAHGFCGGSDEDKGGRWVRRASMLGIFLEDLVCDFAAFGEQLLFVGLQELGEELALLLCEDLRGHAGYVPVCNADSAQCGRTGFQLFATTSSVNFGYHFHWELV